MLATESLRDDVDAFGGSPREDDLVPVGGIDVGGNLVARALVVPRRPLAEGVDASMDIGIIEFVIAADGVYDRAGFLRCCSVVEVDERTAADGLREDGKFLAYVVNVQLGTVKCCAAHLLFLFLLLLLLLLPIRRGDSEQEQ